MAKGFLINGTDFDDLFEAVTGGVTGVTFTGLSPTCTYMYRLTGTNPNSGGYFKYNSTIFDACPKGYVPMPNTIYTCSSSGTYEIAAARGGVSVNGTTYYDSSRGSYKYNRVGIVLWGGGGAGGNSFSFSNARISNYPSSIYANLFLPGGGGGGGGVAFCVLKVGLYPYTITVGAGGTATTSSTDYGTDGGNTVLKSGSTSLVTAYGGKHGNRYSYDSSSGLYYVATGGAGGTVTWHETTYVQKITSTSGGAGGNGGAFAYSSDEVVAGTWGAGIEFSGSMTGSVGKLTYDISGGSPRFNNQFNYGGGGGASFGMGATAFTNNAGLGGGAGGAFKNYYSSYSFNGGSGGFILIY